VGGRPLHYQLTIPYMETTNLPFPRNPVNHRCSLPRAPRPHSTPNNKGHLTSYNSLFGKSKTTAILACDRDVSMPHLKQVSTRAIFNGNTSTLLHRQRHLQATRLHGGITVNHLLPLPLPNLTVAYIYIPISTDAHDMI